MENLDYKLEVFEGPLDLLLSLISKHKIDIFDINISLILEQYLGYLELMKKNDLEVTSEFIAMASHLIFIKSQMLLPKKEEEVQELKMSLSEALIEYQRHKEGAKGLWELFEKGPKSFIKGSEGYISPDEPYSFEHSPDELKEAFLRIFLRNERKMPPPITAFTPLVAREPVPVSERISAVLSRLFKERFLRFTSFFGGLKNRSEVVATFLAVLELLKDKKIVLKEEKEAVFLELVKERNGK